MAITASANFKFSVVSSVNDSALSGANATRAGQATLDAIKLAFTAATGKSCSQIEGTLEAATPVDIDLDGASIVSLLGDAITFDVIDFMVVVNMGTTNPMTIEGDFLGLTTDADTIEASTSALPAFRAYGFGDGRSVTETTADVITLTSALGTTYAVLIFGDID